MKVWKWGFWIKLCCHKNIETELVYQKEYDYFNIHLESTRKKDHAGLHFSLEIFGLNLNSSIYDSRHWCYEKNRWYNEGEEINEEE